MAASATVIELKNSRAREAAQHLQAAVKGVAECVHGAEGSDLGELLILIREAGIDRLEAAFAAGVRRFDRSGEYLADGALSVTAWLKWKCKLSGGAAAERVEIGKQLERLPKTEEAFARGDLGYQHVAVIARTAENVGAAAVRTEERILLKAALTMDPGQFTTVAKNFEHRVDAAGALAEVNRAYQRRYLHIGEPQDGIVRLDGLLDAEGGATVPAETVQRYACDAALVRMTGRTELEPELSQASRTLSSATRRALEARDRRCVWPGCGRPSVWCDGHHLVWWTKGGATALPNLALLCRPHHRMAHEGGWSIERRKDDWLVQPPVEVPLRVVARRE